MRSLNLAVLTILFWTISTPPVNADLSVQYDEGHHHIEYYAKHPNRIYATRNGDVYMIDPVACGGGWHGKIGVISANSGYSHPGYCFKDSITMKSSFITTVKPLKLDWSELSYYRCAAESPFSEACIAPISKTILKSIPRK